MKRIMKTTKKKIASLLALMLTARHLSGPALATELPEEAPVEIPEQGTTEQVVIIPESDYIYVNGSNKVFTAAGDLSVLMRLTVTNPGRVHILTSGVDISLVLYDEAAGEVCGVFSSENGVMDASFDATVGTYLLGFSGWGEAAVLAADEAKTAEIFAESGVQSKAEAEASAEAASTDEAGTDASDEAAAEAPAPAEPAPVVIRLPSNETTSLLPFLTAAGLPVKSVVWVDGNIDGRLVSAGANGDWLLTPLTYFDNIELKVRTSDADLSDPSGKITVYTVLISNPDPVAEEQASEDEAEQTEETKETEATTENTTPEAAGDETTEEQPEASADKTTEEQPEASADETTEEQPEASADETTEEQPEASADDTTEEQSDETTEEETEEETATDSSDEETEAVEETELAEETESTEVTEPAEETESAFDPSVPIEYQAEHTKTFPVLPILMDAGAPVNVITAFDGEFEGKLSCVFQNGDLLLTPYNYFENLELSVTATDYLSSDPMASAATYTVLVSNPDPNAAPAEDEATAQPEEEATAESEELAEIDETEEVDETEETEEIEETEETPEDSVPMNITISMERGDGNAIHLFAEDMQLNSADNYSFQWQASRDNEQWFDVEGATEPEYDFTLDSSNANSYWRLVITDKEEAEPSVTE